ncbi:EF-hand domain-containing protein [Lysobacter koreensis]|uniref:EF-hand domain-containing protein n=1 Tax=Lysobacter koreensis TaxID=266122 RepID=A0ABW2YQ48_9GAMM
MPWRRRVRDRARPWSGRHLCVAAAALLTSSAALAQVRASSDYLGKMDSNADGRVALAEYQDWMGYAFARMDRDGDGVLTPAELPGGRGKPVHLAAHRESLAAAFRRQDRNRDGALDARELAAPPQ